MMESIDHNETQKLADEDSVKPTSTMTESETTNKPSEQKTQNSSKLESLSREDLIKLVKKQLLNQKEIKKKLETAKKEAEENSKRASELAYKLENQQQLEGNGECSLLTAELNDYKNAIGIVAKELQECKERLAEKESLIEELSNRIAELQQQKEEIHGELRKKMAEAMELRQAVEEKSKVIGENAKQINGLLVQLNESRQAMQEEMEGMKQTLQTQSQQLAAEERADLAKNAELRRLKCENETLAQRLRGIEEEFGNYRERAEYALKSKTSSEGTTSATPKEENNSPMENVQKSSSGEVNQLVDILRQRNAEISQLSAKCSFLEEEVRSGQSHAKTLVDELNALHDSIGQIRRQSQMERQRIGEEWAERLKGEGALRAEMERQMRAMKEREGKTGREAEGMRLEMERMGREAEEMRKKMAQLTTESSSSSPTAPQKQGQRPPIPPPKSIRPQKLKLLPSICSNQIAGNDQLTMGPLEDVDDAEGGMHSESCSDSLDDLQSILQEAELAPTSDIPTFNVASLGTEDGGSMMAVNSPFNEYSPHFGGGELAQQQFGELQKQLTDCRDLLAESEETNIRFSEQINLLKEEIRRLERNRKREEHLGNELGSEYFKNIVLKFLSPPKVNDERLQLLPVLQTILHLNNAELDLVRRSCAQQAKEDSAEDEGEREPGNGGTLRDWFGWK